jgi:hypothetical protein
MKYIKLYEDIDWEDWDKEENSEENIKFIFDLDNEIYPLSKNLNVNDRVKIKFNNESYYATIIGFHRRKYLTFEFDNYIGGHNGYKYYNQVGKEGYCWNIYDLDNRTTRSDTLNFKWLKNNLKRLQDYKIIYKL